MKKKVLMLSLGVVLASMVAAPVYAEGVIEESRAGASDCERGFFGMRPWYQGLTTKVDGKCVVGTPRTVDVVDEDGKATGKKEAALAPFVWTIILNVLVDMFTITGLVSLVFLVLGGYWYLRSGGDAVLVARGKKTVQSAVIGVAVTLLATMISNLIILILTQAGGA